MEFLKWDCDTGICGLRGSSWTSVWSVRDQLPRPVQTQPTSPPSHGSGIKWAEETLLGDWHCGAQTPVLLHTSIDFFFLHLFFAQNEELNKSQWGVLWLRDKESLLFCLRLQSGTLNRDGSQAAVWVTPQGPAPLRADRAETTRPLKAELLVIVTNAVWWPWGDLPVQKLQLIKHLLFIHTILHLKSSPTVAVHFKYVFCSGWF